MKKFIIFALFQLTMLSCTNLQAQTHTVASVDVKKYLGDWYEIASIPQSFSRGCECTKAHYRLKKNGQLAVTNTCRKGPINSKISTAKGCAKIVDKKSNAKLKVTFFWPFFGDYWIIGLDAEYRYAVVSNPEGSTLWILSRTPTLPKNLLDEALDIAEKNNIDTKKLSYTVQNNCQ